MLRPRRRPRAQPSASSPASPSTCGSTARPVERLPRRSARARSSASSCPTASSSSRARRRCGAPTSTRSSPRSGRLASATRRAYAQALAQRNALLARVRAGGSRASLAAWDRELARHGIALRDDRAARSALVADRFAAAARELGLDGCTRSCGTARARAPAAPRRSRPSSAERVEADLERGFTGHGPHRDDLALLRDGRELRAYGSQGEQRLALLALLLAERDALADERGAPPLLLLDDVMSELDAERRERLVERLRVGQALVTTTDLAHVPGAGRRGGRAAARARRRACEAAELVAG